MCKISYEHIRQSNLIEGIDDPAEDQQSLLAWTYLFEQDIITQEVLLELHRLVVLNQKDLQPTERGQFRTIQVYVGNHVPPHPADILSMITVWLYELQNDDHPIGPKQMHIDFETIHCFVDGNGRTGRMLMWWQQIKKHNHEPTLLKADERQDYYDWFRRARA